MASFWFVPIEIQFLSSGISVQNISCVILFVARSIRTVVFLLILMFLKEFSKIFSYSSFFMLSVLLGAGIKLSLMKFV